MSALADLAAPPTPLTTTPPAPRERADGWTVDRQRAFLTAIADGHTLDAACRHVGMTHQAAYAFRNRAAGASFALGWQAAPPVGDGLAPPLGCSAGPIMTIER